MEKYDFLVDNIEEYHDKYDKAEPGKYSEDEKINFWPKT